VSRLVPTHRPDHHPIFISFFHLPRSIASSLFKLRAWQSFCITSLHVLFGLPLGMEPYTSYSIYFFTQSVSCFHNTCPYHHNLFCCSINIISSIPSLCVNSLHGTLSFTLTLHIHLTILISARWSATSFSFLTGQVSLLYSILLRRQLLHSLPLLINDIMIIMVTLCNRADHYIFALWFLSIFLSFFLWPPYVIGQAIIFLPCSFFLSSSIYLSFFFLA